MSKAGKVGEEVSEAPRVRVTVDVIRGKLPSMISTFDGEASPGCKSGTASVFWRFKPIGYIRSSIISD